MSSRVQAGLYNLADVEGQPAEPNTPKTAKVFPGRTRKDALSN